MRVPNTIKNKMRNLARLEQKARLLSGEIDDWFIKQGYNTDGSTAHSLRSGSGITLEELENGNDITDEFCEAFENGKFENCKEMK